MAAQKRMVFLKIVTTGNLFNLINQCFFDSSTFKIITHISLSKQYFLFVNLKYRYLIL